MSATVLAFPPRPPRLAPIEREAVADWSRGCGWLAAWCGDHLRLTAPGVAAPLLGLRPDAGGCTLFMLDSGRVLGAFDSVRTALQVVAPVPAA